MLYLNEADIIKLTAEKCNVKLENVTLKIDVANSNVTAIVDETLHRATHYIDLGNGNTAIETAEGMTFRIPKENVSPEACEMLQEMDLDEEDEPSECCSDGVCDIRL